MQAQHYIDLFSDDSPSDDFNSLDLKLRLEMRCLYGSVSIENGYLHLYSALYEYKKKNGELDDTSVFDEYCVVNLYEQIIAIAKPYVPDDIMKQIDNMFNFVLNHFSKNEHITQRLHLNKSVSDEQKQRIKQSLESDMSKLRRYIKITVVKIIQALHAKLVELRHNSPQMYSKMKNIFNIVNKI